MSKPPADVEGGASDRPNPGEVLQRSLIKGIAILLPLIVTLFVVSFVVSFISRQLDPLVGAVVATTLLESETLVSLLTVTVFLLVVFVVGFYAEYGSSDGRLNTRFDDFMASIPGIGSVYTSFNEMSELLLDSDTDSFQDVKLVEYPGTDSYVVAFKTADTPDVIAEDTGNEDMITLFMPMAPNPVMGGFVIHVSRERVVDVDLTVEEGIRSIVTSGVAIGEHDELGGLSRAQMRELSIARTGETLDGSEQSDGASVTDDAVRPDRGEYEEQLESIDTEEDR